MLLYVMMLVLKMFLFVVKCGQHMFRYLRTTVTSKFDFGGN
jgi:hypothetical protein